MSAQPTYGVAPLPPDDQSYELVYMLTTSRAVDLFLGDLARKSRSPQGRTVRSYRRILDKFTDTLRPDEDISTVTSDDCRRFLDRYLDRKPGTQANVYKILNSFFEWVDGQKRIKRNPLDFVPRPRAVHPEDLDVKTVSTAEVAQLLAAARTPSERLCLGIAAYMGPRRGALASLRFRDYDRVTQKIRFHEKGGKTIWKPVPHELVTILAENIGQIEEEPTPQWERKNVVYADDYLIPPEGRLSRTGERDDRIIWLIVRRVADRAGIDCHVHALRAAFAVFYLEQDTGPLHALQALMGHSAPSTTQTYLRRLNKDAQMESVRGLSWSSVAATGSPQSAGNAYAASPVVGAGGFEPPNPVLPHERRAGREHSDTDLVEALNQAVSETAPTPAGDRAEGA